MGHLAHQVKEIYFAGFSALKVSVVSIVSEGFLLKPALPDGRASDIYSIDRTGAKPYSSHSKST